MLRNSKIYHRLWYIKRRNSKRLFTYAVLISFIIIFSMLLSYVESVLIPYIKEISEARIREIAVVSVSNAVYSSFAGSINYEDLAIVSKDSSGQVSSVQINMGFTNRLSARISSDLQRLLSELEKEDIKVPAGVLLRSSVFARMGPEINIKVRPLGNIETDISSEFNSAGINQTRHRIVLKIKTRISSVMPVAGVKTEIETKVPLAETIIVGKVPSFYMEGQKQ